MPLSATWVGLPSKALPNAKVSAEATSYAALAHSLKAKILHELARIVNVRGGPSECSKSPGEPVEIGVKTAASKAPGRPRAWPVADPEAPRPDAGKRPSAGP